MFRDKKGYLVFREFLMATYQSVRIKDDIAIVNQNYAAFSDYLLVEK